MDQLERFLLIASSEDVTHALDFGKLDAISASARTQYLGTALQKVRAWYCLVLPGTAWYCRVLPGEGAEEGAEGAGLRWCVCVVCGGWAWQARVGARAVRGSEGRAGAAGRL